MKQFLSIVLRSQFNLFYRFGYTFIPKAGLVEFDGNITDDTQEAIVKQFAIITPFDYDEEYLILHFEKSISENDSFVQFEIQNLVAVYPLSQQAKTSIESKIDQRIRLEKPIFEKFLPKIESEIERMEIEKAISALWKICKIESPSERYVSEIGFENINKALGHRKNGTKANNIQGGDYWEYLIAYDRFDYFPNSTLGYFYDAGQVLAFCKGLPTFEGSTLHNFLEHINGTNPNIKLLDMIKYLENEQQLQGYITQTMRRNVKQYIVAPLYLMLRDEIRNSDEITQTRLFKNIEYLKNFGDNFCYAIILLGAFFGFRKFYDPYYEALDLRFYKGFKELPKETIIEQSQEQITNDLEVAELPTLPIETDKIETQILGRNSEEETKVDKPTDNDNSFYKEKQADISSQYRIIIEEIFAGHLEIKLADIAALIKDRTGKKVTNTSIKNIIKQMDGIEVIPKTKMKPETARRKEATTTLFNE